MSDLLERSEIYQALENDDIKHAKELIGPSLDLCEKTITDWTILHLIAKKNLTDFFKDLIKHVPFNASFLDIRTVSNDTPLMIATRLGNSQILEQFLEKKTLSEEEKQELIDIAVESDQPALIPLITQTGNLQWLILNYLSVSKHNLDSIREEMSNPETMHPAFENFKITLKFNSQNPSQLDHSQKSQYSIFRI